MTSKAGDLVHTGGSSVVFKRLQSAGPSSVNLNRTRDKELGNYETVATTTDTPDLTYSLTSRDVTTSFEELLTGKAYAGRSVADADITAADTTLTSTTAAFTNADLGRTVRVAGAGPNGKDLVATITAVTSATEAELSNTAGTTVADAALTVSQTLFDLATAKAIDVAGQFKAGKSATNPNDIVASALAPNLEVESIEYSFNSDDVSTQTASLRGDSLFWNNASSEVEDFVGTGSANQALVLGKTALPWNGDKVNGTRYALNVRIVETNQRLVPGLDYTEAVTGAGTAKAVTVTVRAAVPAGRTIAVSYQTDVVAVFPQATFQDDLALRPSSVKGKDIELRIGGLGLANRWDKVTTATITWNRQGSQKKELGSAQSEQEFADPEVSGSLAIRAGTAVDFIEKLRQITGVENVMEVIGASDSVALPLLVLIHSPADGHVIKSIYIKDVRFNVPGFNGQVDNETTLSMDLSGDTGEIEVWKGVKPGTEMPAGLSA